MKVTVICWRCSTGPTPVTIPPTETDPRDIQTPEGWLLVERQADRIAWCPRCCCGDCSGWPQ